MVEKYVTNGIFNSVEEREWLAFFEEEERTASAYDNVVETVYDRNDGELKGTPLMQNRKKRLSQTAVIFTLIHSFVYLKIDVTRIG